MDQGRYEHYKGQLYGILVSLTEGGTEARAVLKGFEDRGEELDGYIGLLALQERFDVQTTSSMLGAFLEVVKPGGIKCGPSRIPLEAIGMAFGHRQIADCLHS